MNGGHGDRSFPDCRGNAFHIAGTHVANREDSGQACFEKMRRSSKRPMSSHQVVARQIRARFDESLPVEQYATTEPACSRNTAGHDEKMADVAHVACPRRVVA